MTGHGREGRPVAGILLTGGASRRMGVDKATLEVGGVACAVRVANAMIDAVGPAMEVGPGVSGLPAVCEDSPGSGPLVALVAGYRILRARGHRGAALVLACDMPLLTGAALRFLAGRPGAGSVVPVVDGRPQPLCARWSAADLAAAGASVAEGERSMRSLLERPGVVHLEEEAWPQEVDARTLSDVDSPEDLERLGLAGDL